MTCIALFLTYSKTLILLKSLVTELQKCILWTNIKCLVYRQKYLSEQRTYNHSVIVRIVLFQSFNEIIKYTKDTVMQNAVESRLSDQLK